MFSMLLLADRLRCALSSAAVVALDSLRIAEPSGSGSLAFFDDVGDGEDADSVGDDAVGDDESVTDGLADVGDVIGAVVDPIVEVAEADVVDEEGVDEQPATRAATALTTVRTVGSLRMPAIVVGTSGAGQARLCHRELGAQLVYVACGGYQGPVQQRSKRRPHNMDTRRHPGFGSEGDASIDRGYRCRQLHGVVRLRHLRLPGHHDRAGVLPQ
jgi:hypothetical protein